MKMKLRYWHILSLFINILISSYVTLEAMEVNKPTVAPSPFKASAKRHKGLVQREENAHDILVKPCISLGQSCTAEVSNLIREADEFVVSFMYRMNSPNIINALANKIAQTPVITFLDYAQSIGNSSYHQYVKHLIDIVPTSLVKLGSVSFHHKVVISKKKGKQAIVVIGSANATFESENVHSEDMVFIQSNRLANTLLEEYHKLFTMKVKEEEQTVKIYHVHRVNKGESNTEKLQEFREKLLETDTVSSSEGYTEASITALALSTGFASTGGSKSCFEIVENIFNTENQALFLFENFFTLKPAIQLANKSNAPKLIILDWDKNNESILPLLRKQPQNMVGMFTPYTFGKFHHKLIIQYPYEGEPILYTGSFHLSESAVKNNSELIIGIKSADLPFQYLASIMEQSGLAEDLKVWQFFNLPGTKLILNNDKIKAVVDKTYARALHKMDSYLEKYQRIFDDLSSISKNLPIEELNEQFAKFDNLSTNNQLKQLHEWDHFITISIFKPYYISVLKGKLESLTQRLNIPPLTMDAYWTRYLINMGDWITQAKEKLKKIKKDSISLKIESLKTENEKDKQKEEEESEEKTTFTKEDLKKIHLEISEIQMLYLLLKDAHSYPEEFQKIKQLTTALNVTYS